MNGKKSLNNNKKYDLEAQFKAACDVIQNLPKNGPFQPSNELLLKFYGYYKQATCGSCNNSKPSIFKVVERAKWDAWYSVRDLSKNDAMQGYIDEIKNIIETMPHNEHVQKLFEVIGPFYEYVNDDTLVQQLAQKNLDNHESSDDDEEILITTSGNNGLSLLKPIQNASNGVINSTLASNNGEAIQSDDDEDFCDTTSELANEQELLIQNIKKQLSNADFNINDNLNEFKNEFGENNKNNKDFNQLINKFGGELNSPSSGTNLNYQQIQPIRQSRPGSSQSSINNFGRHLNHGSTSGSAGGYNPPPNENYSTYLTQDTNRQILLILFRLQQDTNNVITRLSYLEANVLSLTNTLQMNRIENSIQMNNQVSSAFSLINNSSQSRVINASIRPSLSASFYNWFKNIDWKTITIAFIWPFVIRLVFYIIKKLRLVVKFKKVKKFGPKF